MPAAHYANAAVNYFTSPANQRNGFSSNQSTMTQQFALPYAGGSADWLQYCTLDYQQQQQQQQQQLLYSNSHSRYVAACFGGADDLTGDAIRLQRSTTLDLNDDGSSMSSSTMTTTFPGKDYIEERVQIDRRKLEHLISTPATHDHVHGRSDNLTAEEFFSQIMTRTSTQITWPSRLKIGAKTKKDPYVKILGRPCDVQLAKDMILTILETRQSRVTLKIDVAFTDHSHIIGKQGRNTQQVMKDTGCHIHFPDSNRNPELEKSNMVSIAGPLQAVEKARHALRGLAPLVISFEIKVQHQYVDVAEMNDDPFVHEISTCYSIGVIIRQNRSSGQPFCVVRGSAHQENLIKEVSLRVQQHFMKSTKACCSTSLEVLLAQQPAVLGPQNANIRLISEITGATIHHPRTDVAGATTFFIQGTIEAVLSARNFLIGCLPVSLIFDFAELQNKSLDIADLERQSNLSIALRPKRNGETKQNIVVRGYEGQINFIYKVRRQFLAKDEPVVVCADYDFMKNFDPSTTVSSAVTTPLMSNSIMSPLVLNTPSISSAMYTGIPTLFGVSPPFSSLAVPQSNFFGVIQNGNVNDLGASQSRPSTTSFSSFGSSRSSPTETQTPNNLLISVSDLANISNQTPMNTSNGHMFNDPVPEDAPLASGLFEAAKKIQENSGNFEWKAPGAERDWVQEKLLANKAMQEKVVGTRVPNDHWVGFGFSRSMPAEQIRKLMESKANCKSNLKDLLEEDEDKIGPWPLEKSLNSEKFVELQQRKQFNSTSYFDSVPHSNEFSLLETDDLCSLLTKLQLTKYVDIFREQEIDTKTFLTMTDEDLKDIGVNAFGPRRKMLVAISEIKERKKPLF